MRLPTQRGIFYTWKEHSDNTVAKRRYRWLLYSTPIHFNLGKQEDGASTSQSQITIQSVSLSMFRPQRIVWSMGRGVGCSCIDWTYTRVWYECWFSENQGSALAVWRECWTATNRRMSTVVVIQPVSCIVNTIVSSSCDTCHTYCYSSESRYKKKKEFVRKSIDVIHTKEKLLKLLNKLVYPLLLQRCSHVSINVYVIVTHSLSHPNCVITISKNFCKPNNIGGWDMILENLFAMVSMITSISLLVSL